MIDDADQVDACGIDPATGLPSLVIIDDRDWTDIVGHMNALQQKVMNYMSFIKSGQLLKELPEAEGRAPGIRIFQRFEPPANVMPLLYGLRQELGAMDIDFTYGPLAEGFEPAQ